MEPITKSFRGIPQRVLILVAIAVFTGVLTAYAVSIHLGGRASRLVESLTGMKCLVTSLRPCFPCGIKASDITIYSRSGEPLFQAKEIRTQVNLLRILQKNRKECDLFTSLQGDQIALSLTRDQNGDWKLPSLFTSRKNNYSAEEGKHPPRKIFFTNVSIMIQARTGKSRIFYKSVEGDLDPERGMATFQLSNPNESGRIIIKKGFLKQYELQGENFPLPLLAPASATPFPFEKVILNGTLRGTTSDNTNFAIEGRGRIRITKIHHPVVSSIAIEDMELPFDLNADLTGSGIENLSVKTDLAGETAMVHGNIEGWEKPVIDMTATFSNFSYDRAISALPVSLHPNLPVIRLSGSMTGTFSFHLDTADPGSLDYRYTGQADRVTVLNLGPEIGIDRLRLPFLHKVRTKTGKDICIMLSPENPDFIPYRKIPSSLVSAVMAAEDLRFFSHRGFSKMHIKGSLVENIKAGRVVRGASTISMQLAKNLFLSPERTLSRKLEEALITAALEQNLDKKRIMEIYLNIIEWGNGIYGIGPAARYYFGKKPAELAPVESAFLASIIARPRNWSPDPLSRVGQGWLKYLQVILCKMYKMEAAEVEDLLEAGVPESSIDALITKTSE